MGLGKTPRAGDGDDTSQGMRRSPLGSEQASEELDGVVERPGRESFRDE